MMLDTILAPAISVAALGAGLMAGVYFAFSGFIMRAFDQLGADAAAKAMNSINEVILRSWFMFVFFGSTLLYAALAALALYDADLPGRWLLLATGMSYVTGMFFCTVVFNVPLNNRLAQTDQEAEAKAETWRYYLEYWTRWNHLRSVCSLATLLMSIHYLVVYA